MSSNPDLWWIGFTFSTITGITFTAVAFLLGRNLQRQKQWKSNPLAVATMLIFTTCGFGHVLHTIQLLYPLLAPESAIGPAARLHYGEWHLWVADGLTAIAGTWYWLSRRAFPNLVSGAAMYENVRRQQRRAVEIHDNVVQGLVKAKWALDLGDTQQGRMALQKTLGASEQMVRELRATSKATEDAE